MTPSFPPHFILAYPDEFTEQEVQWAERELQNNPQEQIALQEIRGTQAVVRETLDFERFHSENTESITPPWELGPEQKHFLKKVSTQSLQLLPSQAPSVVTRLIHGFRSPELWILTTALGCLALFLQTQSDPSSSPSQLSALQFQEGDPQTLKELNLSPLDVSMEEEREQRKEIEEEEDLKDVEAKDADDSMLQIDKSTPLFEGRGGGDSKIIPLDQLPPVTQNEETQKRRQKLKKRRRVRSTKASQESKSRQTQLKKRKRVKRSVKRSARKPRKRSENLQYNTSKTQSRLNLERQAKARYKANQPTRASSIKPSRSSSSLALPSSSPPPPPSPSYPSPPSASSGLKSAEVSSSLAARRPILSDKGIGSKKETHSTSTPWIEAKQAYQRGETKTALLLIMRWIERHPKHPQYQKALSIGIRWARKSQSKRYLQLFESLKQSHSISSPSDRKKTSSPSSY